ncbi:DUF2750 domain-containing protein [Pseudomonas sp. UC 17F4]|uniref:DUF2750 domain-containing protein n=1 Tax=unclassified Pseudomonas TaxID=196821 RepID=UPI00087FAD74|nr:Protein of unknown function [Pseudomonas sp. UC 17F4]
MQHHPKKISNIVSLSKKERYEYFLRKVTDSMKLWGLFDAGWATLQAENSTIVPLWPEECFAKICATNEWSNLEPQHIDLQSFIDKWIPGLEGDNHLCLIFPTPSDQGMIITAHSLHHDLKRELSQYE